MMGENISKPKVFTMKKDPIFPLVLFCLLAVLHFLSAILDFWKTPGFLEFEITSAIVIIALIVVHTLREKIQWKLPVKIK